MTRHIIFDCDGVLIDTEIVAAEVAARWLGTYQVNITPEEFIHQHTGKMFSNIIRELQESGDLPTDLDMTTNLEVLERDILDHMRPVSGVKEMLQSISLPKSVVSNSYVHYVKEALSKFELASHFNTPVFSSEMVAKGKPSPLVYELAARTIGVDKEALVAIEDSYTGVQAATSAGIPTIGFLGGSHIRDGHAERLQSLGVIHVAHDHRELSALLSEISA